MSIQRIAFFDSGIGGLTVLKEALKILPREDYIYYADTEHVPYGTKTKSDIKKYILEAVEFIAGQKVKALVVACNTATSIAINALRQNYSFPIIGMEPAVKPAVEHNGNNKRILVLATPVTLKEEKFQNLVSKVDSEKTVDVLALPELVAYAEQFIFDGKIINPYLKEKLAAYNLAEYSTVVLGCTHFPYYRKNLKEVLPRTINIIDGNLGTVKHLKRLLEERIPQSLNKGKGDIVFYSSGEKEDSERYLKYLDIL
ncbi:MAG: glutamate racemase [Candidatus Margulisbacteria bacterium]|nr:glutamate racemase [Candidatus Margulisiibacteriota bacterium]